MTARIVVNDQEFPLHYELLLAIAKNLPASEHYRPLAKALVALGVPSITCGLLKYSGALLAQDDLDALWGSGDADIRRCLVEKAEFVGQLTDAQAQAIIATDDPQTLKSTARQANLLYPARTGVQGMRLSGAMADTLLEHLAHSRYPEVRLALADDVIPFKFRPPFRECLESGFSVKSAFSGIQPEDIVHLRVVPLETLQHMAYSVEKIANSEARKGVIHLLCAHPDPSVRLELAKNSQAPKSALVRLLTDVDPDVCLMASETLADIGYYEEGTRFAESASD